MTTNLPPAVIGPLVVRHVEDAAFYWSQHDSSAASPHLALPALARFSQMLVAHLDALDVAGAHAWPHSHAALQRWQKPAEAFVCTWGAAKSGDPAHVDVLLQRVRAKPHALLRGVISALAWLPPALSSKCIERWTLADSDSVTQVAALRAAALVGPNSDAAIGQPLAVFLASADAHVRAAACRVAARAHDAAAILAPGLNDAVSAVRAEAAIALALASAGTDDRAACVLSDCVAEQITLARSLTGWYAAQAHRRLARWVRYLALIGAPASAALLDAMPARLRLMYMAWRGDPACIPDVIGQMRQPDVARYAGWVWQTITGVDLVAAGLVMPEPASGEEPVKAVAVDVDSEMGLALPDVDAVGRYPVALPGDSGQRYLAGRPVDTAHLLDILLHAPQAVRSIAATRLRVFHRIPVDVRSCALAQRAAIVRLMDEGGGR